MSVSILASIALNVSLITLANSVLDFLSLVYTEISLKLNRSCMDVHLFQASLILSFAYEFSVFKPQEHMCGLRMLITCCISVC